MLNKLLVYNCYHDKTFVTKYDLYENNWFKPYYTKEEVPNSLNHLQEFFCEFVSMFYVLNNVDLSQYDYIGFEHYRRKGVSQFVQYIEFNDINLVERNFRCFCNRPYSGNIDYFLSTRFEGFLYDDFKTFITLNYKKDSLVYKIFIQKQKIDVKWAISCMYLTRVEYFKEIAECIYNFVLYINDKYNLQFDYDKYKKFIEDNWINAKLTDKVFDYNDVWLITPPSNKYRIFAYMFEMILGFYFGFIIDNC